MAAQAGECACFRQIGCDHRSERQKLVTRVSMASRASRRLPLVETITGSSTIGMPRACFFKACRNALHDLRRAQHADLDGVGADIVQADANLVRARSSAAADQWNGRRCVSCTVTAVMAVMAYTPKALAVLISAWMPAPPPESEPAMTSRRGGLALKQRLPAPPRRCRARWCADSCASSPSAMMRMTGSVPDLRTMQPAFAVQPRRSRPRSAI